MEFLGSTITIKGFSLFFFPSIWLIGMAFEIGMWKSLSGFRRRYHIIIISISS